MSCAWTFHLYCVLIRCSGTLTLALSYILRVDLRTQFICPLAILSWDLKFSRTPKAAAQAWRTSGDTHALLEPIGPMVIGYLKRHYTPV